MGRPAVVFDDVASQSLFPFLDVKLTSSLFSLDSLEYALHAEGHSDVLSTILQRFVLAFKPLIKDMRFVQPLRRFFLSLSLSFDALTEPLLVFSSQGQEPRQAPRPKYVLSLSPALFLSPLRTKLPSSPRRSFRCVRFSHRHLPRLHLHVRLPRLSHLRLRSRHPSAYGREGRSRSKSSQPSSKAVPADQEGRRAFRGIAWWGGGCWE